MLIAASVVVGQAILSLCGRRELTWLAGPVGLAAILVVSGIAIKLPGHGTAVAIALAALFVLSLASLASRRRGRADPTNVRSTGTRGRCDARMQSVRRGRTRRSPSRPGLALLLASIPFIVNGRVGILGVGLVNDDMASHLLIADWLNTRVGPTPGLIDGGYPVGPHALAAGLSEGLGTGLIEAFAGITLAIPVLTALVAFGVLRDLRPLPRVLAAALVALPYLAAAYLAQGAFKEPIEALFLLAFALLLPGATSVRRGLPLAVIAAGAVYAYSFPGLFWLLGAAAIYIAIALIRGGCARRRSSGGRRARAALCGLRPSRWPSARSWSWSPPSSAGSSTSRTSGRSATPRSRAGSATCAIRCRRWRRWGSGRRATSVSRRAMPARRRSPSTSAPW